MNDPDATPQTLRLNAVGDVYLARRISRERGDRLARVIDLMHDSDVTIGNVEMVIHDWSAPHAALTGATWAVADPALADELSWLGLGMAGLANNHSSEFGDEGYASTRAALEEQDITHAGIGRNLAEARRAGYRDTSAGRVGLLASTSSYMPDAPASHPRADAPGRPGLNPLRFDTTYVVDGESMAAIERMAEGLQLDTALREHRTWSFDKVFAVPDSSRGRKFMQQAYVVGDTFGVSSSMDTADLAEHLKYVKEARRQADWVIVSVHCHDHDTAKNEPPQFLKEFARACVDAGADAFLGHGPHITQGIELYRDRPIFYSLGNFVFHLDMWEQQPADGYTKFQVPQDATVADLYEKRGDGSRAPFFNREIWESVLAQCELRKDGPPNIQLHPVELGLERPRSNAGTPRIAVGEQAQRILENINELSKPFGTEIVIEDGIGRVRQIGASS